MSVDPEVIGDAQDDVREAEGAGLRSFSTKFMRGPVPQNLPLEGNGRTITVRKGQNVGPTTGVLDDIAYLDEVMSEARGVEPATHAEVEGSTVYEGTIRVPLVPVGLTPEQEHRIYLSPITGCFRTIETWRRAGLYENTVIARGRPGVLNAPR